jgi:selenocysteine-specific elongation factor
MPAAVLGTAGHIDHGKSALVRALTGSDPDRLPEERRRGITIALGYALLRLPSGRTVSVVDVPGHERFIKTMASGAAVIDLAMLVIDAGDGVKPQSVEHLGILEALNVRSGLVVLTKCDTVDSEIAELAAEEARDLVEGTFLEGAPVVMTSAVAGTGLDELRAALDALMGDFRSTAVRQPVRLPVDRSFVMPGFGTVVTGTLLGGTLHAGDRVEIQPAGLEARIRTVQVHGEETGLVQAPARAALNLSGVEADPVLRGQWIVRPGGFRPASSVLATVRLMPWAVKPIRLPALMSLNLGASMVNCEVHGVADGPRQLPLVAATTHLVRIDAEEPLVARGGDRFVLRVGGGLGGSFSTAAGGIVVDPLWGKRRLTANLERQVTRIDLERPESWLRFALHGSALEGLALSELAQRVPAIPARTEAALERMLGRREAIRLGRGRAVTAEAFERTLERSERALRLYHEKHPERTGIKRDALRDRSVGTEARALFESVLGRRVREGAWKVDGDLVALSGHEPRSGTEVEDLSRRVLDLIRRDPSSPPSLKALAERLEVPREAIARVADLLVADGRARLLDGEFLFDKDFLGRLKSRVQDFFEHHDRMMVTDLKSLAEVSRKHALPLARWLDDEGVTTRRGDYRVRR